MGIGRKVDGKELQEVLDNEARVDELMEKVLDQITALRVGECLAYEANDMLVAGIALASLTSTIKGKFRVISGVREKYVYREK